MRTHSSESESASPVPRSKRPSTILVAACTLILLLTTWIFPPSQPTINGLPTADQHGANFRSIFAPSETWTDGRTFVVNWNALIAIDVAIVIAAVGTLVFLRHTQGPTTPSNRRQHPLKAAALSTGLILLATAWFFPPWTATKNSQPLQDQRGSGFHYIFRPQEVWTDNRTFHIDWQTLAIINLGVILATAAALTSIRSQVD